MVFVLFVVLVQFSHDSKNEKKTTTYLCVVMCDSCPSHQRKKNEKKLPRFRDFRRFKKIGIYEAKVPAFPLRIRHINILGSCISSISPLFYEPVKADFDLVFFGGIDIFIVNIYRWYYARNHSGLKYKDHLVFILMCERSLYFSPTW